MGNDGLVRPERRETASRSWLASAVFHACLLLMLGFMRSIPSGSAELDRLSTGIILMHSQQPLASEFAEPLAANDGVTLTLDAVRDAAEASEGKGEKAAPEAPARELDVEAAAVLAALPSSETMHDILAISPHGSDGLGLETAGDRGVPIASALVQGGAGQPRGVVGGKARVRVFGLEGEGRKFVYVFDRSTSMAGHRLHAAQEELIRSLDALESTHQFQIVYFNHQQRVFDLSGGQKRFPFATDQTKQLAAIFVRNITAQGGTDRFLALSVAVGMRPDVIFFLTDDDNPMSADELDQIRRRNRGSASIQVIQFGLGPTEVEEGFLARLARQNGGQYVYINSSALEP